MDDDTRRALRELAEIVRSGTSYRSDHMPRLDALVASLDDPPAPSTVDVLGSELRVGDVVIGEASTGVVFDHSHTVTERPFARNMTSTDCGYLFSHLTYRVRLPRPEVAAHPWPDDDDPEWRDVPAERAAFKTLREGDRYWDCDRGPWTISAHRNVTTGEGLRWIKRHDHPSRKRAPSVAVDAPADALPSWVDVPKLVAAYAALVDSTDGDPTDEERVTTIALAVLRMQQEHDDSEGLVLTSRRYITDLDARMRKAEHALAQRTSATDGGADIPATSAYTSRGADGPTEPRTSTQPETVGGIAVATGSIVLVGGQSFPVESPSRLAVAINAAHRAAVASLVAERDAARTTYNAACTHWREVASDLAAARETIAAALRLCFDLEGACRRPGSQSEAHALDVIARIRAELKGGA